MQGDHGAVHVAVPRVLDEPEAGDGGEERAGNFGERGEQALIEEP